MVSDHLTRGNLLYPIYTYFHKNALTKSTVRCISKVSPKQHAQHQLVLVPTSSLVLLTSLGNRMLPMSCRSFSG